MTIALDACVIIYLLEGGGSLGASVHARIRELLAPPDSHLFCSRLARLECRVGPMRHGNGELLARYEEFFDRRRVIMVDVSSAIIERATDLRAHHGFKTADAIHLATALDKGAERFLTGDRRLSSCPGLTVEVVEPESIDG